MVQEGDQAATQVGAREEAVRWSGILRDDATQLAQDVHLPLAATDDVGVLGSAVSSKARDDGYLCADDGCIWRTVDVKTKVPALILVTKVLET